VRIETKASHRGDLSQSQVQGAANAAASAAVDEPDGGQAGELLPSGGLDAIAWL